MMSDGLGFPDGLYDLYADDDDVIGLTVARTSPHEWPIVRIDPPYLDAFDEFEVGNFIAWCLTNRQVIQGWRRALGDDDE
jgi:hypothetical protein